MKKRLAILLTLVMVIALCAGCTAADNVNHNLTQAADNFQCLRKITVYNARTDLIVMEMEGYFENALKDLIDTGAVVVIR